MIRRVLLASFLASVEAASISTVRSSMMHQNAASLALHGQAGFRQVGALAGVLLSEMRPCTGIRSGAILIEWCRSEGPAGVSKNDGGLNRWVHR